MATDRISIELEHEEAKALKAYYLNSKAELTQKIADLQGELLRVNRLLESLSKKLEPVNGITKEQMQIFPTASKSQEKTGRFALGFSNNGNGEYSPSWSWYAKVEFLLKKAEKLMSVTELLNAVRVYEPYIGSGMDEGYRKVQANVSAMLKGKVDNGKLKRIKSTDTNEFYYGFTNWFDSKDLPKPNYV